MPEHDAKYLANFNNRWSGELGSPEQDDYPSEEEMDALNQRLTASIVAEHAKGSHAPNYVELGCEDCLTRNPICSCGKDPMNHRVSTHLKCGFEWAEGLMEHKCGLPAHPEDPNNHVCVVETLAMEKL